MKRLLSLMLLVALAPACGANRPRSGSGLADVAVTAPGVEYFFHWGSVAANNDVLSRAGYAEAQGHESNLGTAAAGSVNTAMIDLTRGWYNSGGASDASGPGLYASSNATDSEGYGPDLLVVIRESTDGAALPPIAFEDSYTFRQAATDAILHHTESALPAMNLYSSSWHVIFRPPNASDGYTLRIRPPQAGDGDKITASLLQHKTADQLVQSLSGLCQNSPHIIATKTVPAQAMFKSLSGDVAFDLLSKLAYEDLTPYTTYIYDETATCMAGGDPAKRAALDANVSRRLIGAVRPLTTAEWTTMSTAFDSLTTSDQTKVLAKFEADAKLLFTFDQTPNPFALGGSYAGALGGADAMVPRLSDEAKAAVAAAIVANLPGAKVSIYQCTSMLSDISTHLQGLPDPLLLSLVGSVACFSEANVSSGLGYNGEFYEQYLWVMMRLKTLPGSSAAQVASVLSKTIIALRRATAQPVHGMLGDQAIAAGAALAGATTNVADKALLLAAIRAAATATAPDSGGFAQLSLGTLYAVHWVKLLGFSAAVRAVAAIEPSARPALTSQLNALKATIADSVEAGNIDALIAILQTP